MVTKTTKPETDPPAKPKRVRKKKEPTAAEVRKEKARTERALYWRLLQAKKKKLAALKFLAEYQKRNRIEYFNGPHPLVNGKFLRANPKQQLILDAWNNPLLKTFCYTGGNRCLGGETPIYDPIADVVKPIAEIDSDFHVMAFDGVHMVPAFAFKPFQTESEQLYRVTLSTGEWFVASGRHRVLSNDGWRAIAELPSRSVLYLHRSTLGTYPSARVSNVPHWIETVPDSQGGCPAYYGFCGEPPRLVTSSGLTAVPSPAGARKHTLCACAARDGLGSTLEHNHPCQHSVHLSTRGALVPPEALCVECECRASCIVWLSSDLHIRAGQQPTPAVDQHPGLYKHAPPNHSSTSVSAVVTKERVDAKWDIHVPVYNNYWAGGVIHQNSGKTTLAVMIALSTMKGYWPWNKQPLPFPHKEARKVRLICQDWESGARLVILPELKKWWPEIWPRETRKNNMGVESWWVDKETGSTLEIMTGNQDPMLHEGGHHDLIIFDEPVSRAHYIANARGLVDRRGRELFTMTLLEQPWIDREIVRKKLPDGRPDPSVFVVETKTTDNVGFGLSQRGLDDFAAKLTDEEREVRIEGVPRYKKGLVYPMFDPKIHCKPRFKIPLDWPVDIAIDTHPRKPHSVLFLATNPHGYKYCIAEIRMHGDGKQLADEIVRMVQWGMYRVNRIIIDPLSKGDDNSPEGSTYHKIAEELGRYDMLLEVASKNKDTGILAVKEHLKGPNDEPSLFFFDDLVYTVNEVEGLMWEKPQLDDKEKAVKEQDDMPECLYRLILLDTEYVPPVDEDEAAGGYERTGVSSTTGY